jgi:cytochrome P450
MTSTEPVALPLTRQCPYAPPPEHLRLRDEQPVARVRLPSGMTVWALTRHEDIRAMLTDPRFSSDRNRPGFPAFTHDPIPVSLSLLGMDPPEHGPARRAVMGEFTLKRITALRPRIQQIVDERVDALLAGPRPVDLVPALSLPVPSLVTCELLGVPYAVPKTPKPRFHKSKFLKISKLTTPSDVPILNALDILISLLSIFGKS